MATRRRRPRCIVIAGPNGAGKTTFAREYLPGIARVVHFVKADLIAGGLSPLKPELAAIAAARMSLWEIDRLATERADFAFETTLRRIEARVRQRARCTPAGRPAPLQARLGKLPNGVPTHGGILGGVRQFGGITAARGKEEMKVPTRPKRPESLAAGVGRALRQAAKAARKTARMHGTPIYIVEDGKVVAKRP